MTKKISIGGDDGYSNLGCEYQVANFEAANWHKNLCFSENLFQQEKN